MKKLIYLSIVAIIGIVVYVYASPYHDHKAISEGGVSFYEGSWEDALQKASEEEKVIFLDVYASWCGYCKKLKSNTLSDEQVGEYFNSHFVNMALDGETGYGAEIVKKYQLQGYPTLLFIDAKGNLILKKGGYRSPEELLKLGKEINNL